MLFKVLKLPFCAEIQHAIFVDELYFLNSYMFMIGFSCSISELKFDLILMCSQELLRFCSPSIGGSLSSWEYLVQSFSSFWALKGFSTKCEPCIYNEGNLCEPAVANAIFSTVAFLLGALISVLSGFLGMKIATYANARTVEARKGIGKARLLLLLFALVQ